MPLFIVLMLIIGSVYQLFFRFEHWIDPQQNKIVYERDNLTGQTHIIRPGEPIEFFSRLVGTWNENSENDKNNEKNGKLNKIVSTLKDNGPFALSFIENETEAKNQTKSTSSPIPEPKNTQPISLKNNRDRSDLNRDGVTERVLIHQTARDGLLDISVLEGQREIFYGRGQRIHILPTNTAGWSDIALEINPQEKLVFRYNPALSGYEVQSQ